MVSYGIFVVLLFLIVASVLTIVFAPMVNTTTEIVNEDISDGALSTKYVTWYNLIVGLCKALPLFAIVGAVGWAIIRALEKRNTEGV